MTNKRESHDIFEMSTSEMRENESEVDIKAHLINFNMKTGPRIGNNLAHNHDLVSQDNGTQIMKLREDYNRSETYLT